MTQKDRFVVILLLLFSLWTFAAAWPSQTLITRGEKKINQTSTNNDTFRVGSKVTIEEFLQRNERISAEVNRTLLRAAATGQTASLFAITCSDSRAPSGLVLGDRGGEIFISRNIANRYDFKNSACVSGLSYAVEKLQISHVAVIGHDDCGGVGLALDQAISITKDPQMTYDDESPGLLRWVKPITLTALAKLQKLYEFARTDAPTNGTHAKNIWSSINSTTSGGTRETLKRELVELNVLDQVDAITYSPTIRKAWESGNPVQIHGWVYEVATGQIRILDTRSPPDHYKSSKASQKGQ